ncbi:probable RNA-binding protein 19 [Anopheles maculipalpis]|uniref:probable RNA-binding protein 19 n=1 Tax=Anopheles maculipalpis TaxID=1496333 RepID=UPI002158FFBA|nr:probable RNA-binding protein 19 [Anopheles maculipalpis]
MSRIIVKNIPNGYEEAKLRNHFSTCGIVTDVQLKYTPDGKFRNFGYIGFQTEDQAEKAIKHFDNSFIRTSKISVAPCVSLYESKQLKVWSKHAKKQAAPVKSEEEEENKKVTKEKPKPQTAKDVLGQYQDDPQFQEYLDAHKRAGKTIWDNQLQQKDTEQSCDTAADKKSASDDSAIDIKRNNDSKPNKKPEKKTAKKPMIRLFVVKLQNIPARTKRQDIIRFFKNVKPHSVRVPPKIKGIAFVGFKTESEMHKALLMDKSFLDGKQVKIIDYTDHSDPVDAEATNDPSDKKLSKWERQARANASVETIGESGKLFFRNLAYSVQEEDIRTLFEKYGPVAEVDVPIDSITRKLKGFGTVTFMIPENAVTAFNELNGTFLQGRMFHILPAKGSGDADTNEGDENGTDYQKKKEQTLKKTAQSSHNWNTLFMGENAVAEAVAKKYGTSKEQILVSSEGETSAAVRLALGETELVLEMQTFLQENNISLDAFNSTDGKAKRSNTVILAKNLAPGCTVAAVRQLFAPFGLLGRVVLPPSAVTAVIEFLDPSEARKAFKKLAYSMFQSLPLYLEWAPLGTFTTAPPPPSEAKNAEQTVPTFVPTKVEPEAVDDTEPEENTTLFLRNLPFTTDEDTIRERFRTVGAIHSVQIARSKDLSGSGKNESRGYGFIQFKKRHAADYALKNLQSLVIDGRTVELVRSDRTLQTQHNRNDHKKSKAQAQTGSKILVRNIPFQASAKEVRDLFKPFGDINTLRLPKKMAASADESHRGFGFVDFVEESDAKRAFNTLGRSTHLYGRRLVLEWAAPDNDVEELRKRTADQFGHDGSGGKRAARGKGLLSTEEFVSASQRKNEEDDDEYDEGYENGTTF